MRLELEQLAHHLEVTNQADLAAWLQVSRVTVNRWAKGHERPSSRRQWLIRLAPHIDPALLRFLPECSGDRLHQILLLCPGTVKASNQCKP